MNATEQLPTVAEKAAHTAPRRLKRPHPAVPTTEHVARAAAAPGFSPQPLPTVVRNPITDGDLGPGHGVLPIAAWTHPLRATFPRRPGRVSWYGEDPDDDVPELQPWPDYNARI